MINNQIFLIQMLYDHCVKVKICNKHITLENITGLIMQHINV